MRDEGVTKYECIFTLTHAPDAALTAELSAVRNHLFAQKLIGVYPDGIGYGNVSIRLKNGPGKFIITGTQTGHKPSLEPADYSLVTSYDIDKNRVECEGLVAASSESMTHAAVYEFSPEIAAVLHIHSRALWQRGAEFFPATNPGVAYGTPAMAQEMNRLYRSTDLRDKKILVMQGHEDGVITFGTSLAEARNVLAHAFAVPLKP